MRNFDRFIGIDWSGAKSPVYTPSISIAMCEQGQAAPELIKPPSQKFWSRQDVADFIKSQLSTSKRILIGIDANFGYAREVIFEQFGSNANYMDLWSAIERSSQGDDNFFAQSYWKQWPEYFWTRGKRPDHIKLPRRLVENACGEAGLGWPESPFKLIGPKQVGKGGLSAMRMAYALKEKCSDDICFWPFERDICDDAKIVISEIYPRQFLKRSAHGNAKVKTVEDLNIALSYFDCEPFTENQDVTDHDTDALISAAGLRWLCGKEKAVLRELSHPRGLDLQGAKVEGWIFGVNA